MQCEKYFPSAVQDYCSLSYMNNNFSESNLKENPRLSGLNEKF